VSSEGVGRSVRIRRAFGCITWVNMGMLVFLAAAFLLPLPFRYLGEPEIFEQTFVGLTLYGLFLIVPGMIVGAILGYRTYRGEPRRSRRVGSALGAMVGWTSFFFFAWLDSALGYLFVPLSGLATGMVLYALFSGSAPERLRRRLVGVAAAIVLAGGLVVLALDFALLGITGAVFAAMAAAAGGYVAGIGYSRAGGEEALPPEIRERLGRARAGRRKK
jgi:hypothetical protein